jgi:hypothetical protein
MKQRGYDVVGDTTSKHPLDDKLYAKVLAEFAAELERLPAP